MVPRTSQNKSFMKKIISFYFFAISCLFVNAQETEEDSLMQDAPKVYIDCFFCDQEYFRQQTPYLNYVRDRLIADVHVLATRQNTGSGGSEMAFQFIGQGEYEGMADTLTFSSGPNQTSDEIRVLQLLYLRLGMIRFLAQTDLAEFLDVSFTREVEAEEVKDPWNNWVFNFGISGWFNGQESYNSSDIWSSVRADQVKEGHRIALDAGFSYNEQNFTVDGEKIRSLRRSQYGGAHFVKSINNHWSWGLFNSVYSSIYSNLDFQYNSQLGIEYNLFPYSESSRKQLRFTYQGGVQHNFYNDTTVYGKIEELMPMHNLEVAFELVEKWGSIWTSVRASQFLPKPEFYNIRMGAGFNLRLLKGLSFNLSGNFIIIRDQIALPASGATEEEILLQQKQLATGYEYWGSAGLNYTFGSIYNNVVNPRFGW